MSQDLTTQPNSNFGKFKVYRASTMPRRGAMFLLFGAGGAGKTTLAGSAPGRKVFLDYDRRTNVLANRDDVDIILMDKYQEAVDFFHADPAKNWDIIVLDNASELAQIQYVKFDDDAHKDPRQRYNAVQVDIISLFKFCREYAARTGICIIWNAWEAKVTDVLINGVASERTAPYFAPSLANNLLGLAQFVGYLSKEGETRELIFESDKVPVKWGVAPNDVAAEIPRKIKNPSLDPILRTLIGGEPYKP